MPKTRRKTKARFAAKQKQKQYIEKCESIIENSKNESEYTIESLIHKN